ncbi:MAG: maleylpyruvate isomerase N-terminal domain-containing protein [Chloroflexota bacterium]
MNDFSAPILASDILAVQDVFADNFSVIDDNSWSRKTEANEQGWTLHETICHLDTVSKTYLAMIEAAVADQTYTLPQVTTRADFPRWMAQEIERRSHLTPQDNIAAFLETLQQTASFAETLSSEDLAKKTNFFGYNQMISVAELLGAQSAHPAIVHGAQVACGARIDPLWHHLPPDLIQRQLTHLFRQMALVYWPERGGALQATITFIIAGEGGGRWQLTLSPEGATAKQGAPKRSDVTLWFRTADTYCQVITLQLSPFHAVLTGRSFVWGKVWLALRLKNLFSVT